MKSEMEIRDEIEKMQEKIDDRMDITTPNHKLAGLLRTKKQALEWVLNGSDR